MMVEEDRGNKAGVEDRTGARVDPFDFDGMEELAEYHMGKNWKHTMSSDDGME